jgi:hypothetical protein
LKTPSRTKIIERGLGRSNIAEAVDVHKSRAPKMHPLAAAFGET